MNKLFIHQPIFRILSPLFSGILIYVLTLLLNNNVGQLEEQFLGQELYFSISLSLITQESIRLLLLYFAKSNLFVSLSSKVIAQVLSTLIYTFILVSLALYYYYDLLLGFTPSFAELLEYNIICVLITVIYVSLFLSHQLLNLINTQKINVELEKKDSIKEDYLQFIQGINPSLLFEGLEALIIQIKLNQQIKNPEHVDIADDIVDNLAIVYRYTLGNRGKELVSTNEELEILNHFVALYDQLPYRKIQISNELKANSLILPGLLIQLTELFIKNSIRSNQLTMEIILEEENNYLLFKSQNNDKIGVQFPNELIDQLNRKYQLYSSKRLKMKTDDDWRKVYIPIIPHS